MQSACESADCIPEEKSQFSASSLLQIVWGEIRFAEAGGNLSLSIHFLNSLL
jgi:hypothetical protein